MNDLLRTAGERMLTWLYTGPLGHLWSVAADVVEFSTRRLVRR